MKRLLIAPLLISLLGCSPHIKKEKPQSLSINVQNVEGEEINVLESSIRVKNLYFRDLKTKIAEKLTFFEEQKDSMLAEKYYYGSIVKEAKKKVQKTCNEEFINILGDSNCNRNKGILKENQYYVDNAESILEPTLSAIVNIKRLQRNLDIYEESFALVHQKEITYEPIFKNIRVRDPVDECDLSSKNNWTIPKDCMVERNKKVVNCFNPSLNVNLKKVWVDNIWRLNTPPDEIKYINDKLYREICKKYGF